MRNVSAPRCAPCMLDQQCLANNVVYFSFLVPLHNQVVYSLAIGCATGQSCFVALERRCKCLVWASIPFDTILASYCLFEVVIDRAQGGTFVGCQNVLDQLFGVIRFSSQVSLHRMPYIQERHSDRERKVGFISTLKQLFRVSSFTRLASVDLERLRRLDAARLWAALVINSDGLPRWAERIFNAHHVRKRCVSVQIVSSEVIVARTADMTFSKRVFVTDMTGVLDNADATRSQIRITIEQTQDSTKHSTKLSEISGAHSFDNTATMSDETEKQKKAIMFTKVLETGSTFVMEGPSDNLLLETPRTAIEQKTKLEQAYKEMQKASLYSEVIRLDEESKIKTMESEIWYNSAKADIHKETSRFKLVRGPDSFETSFDPTTFYDEDSFERQFSLNKKFSSIRNVHTDNKYKEIEAVIRKSPQTMMDIAADLHQCGLPTGNRVTEPHEVGQRKLNESTTNQPKSYSESGPTDLKNKTGEVSISSKREGSQIFPRVMPHPKTGSPGSAMKDLKSLPTKDHNPTGSANKQQSSKVPERNSRRLNESIITPVHEGNQIFTHAMPLATDGSPSFSGEMNLDNFLNRFTANDDSTATRATPISDMCTSTSTTEKRLTPELVSRLQDVDSRSQTWTPAPLSLQDLISNMHNRVAGEERRLQRQILNWERKLTRVMEACMLKEIF